VRRGGGSLAVKTLSKAKVLRSVRAPVPLMTVTSFFSVDQGLTLLHFSAQFEPSLSQENTLHTLNTP
jgi:hypothetical protein